MWRMSRKRILSTRVRARPRRKCRISCASPECATGSCSQMAAISGYSFSWRIMSHMDATVILVYCGEPRRANACAAKKRFRVAGTAAAARACGTPHARGCTHHHDERRDVHELHHGAVQRGALPERQQRRVVEEQRVQRLGARVRGARGQPLVVPLAHRGAHRARGGQPQQQHDEADGDQLAVGQRLALDEHGGEEEAEERLAVLRRQMGRQRATSNLATRRGARFRECTYRTCNVF